MNYKRIYESIIDRAKSRVPEGYVERHHIIPRCMGGTDDNSNLVALTPEEHFLAHILLVKMYPEERNLILAVQKMCAFDGSRVKRKHRKLYGWLKRKHAARMRELQSGEGNSQFGKRWITNGTDNRSIPVSDPIPSGWKSGRVLLSLRSPATKSVTCSKCGHLFEVKRRSKASLCSPCLSARKSELAPRTPYDLKAIQEWIDANKPVTYKQISAEFGISMEPLSRCFNSGLLTR